MRTDDDALLELLGTAIRPAVPAEPTLAEMMALEEAVRFPAAPPRRRFRVDRRAAAVLLSAGMLATSGTAFAFEQSGVPDPVRAAAHAVGLPVDSPAEHDAREAALRLREALRRNDDDQVRAAAADLEQRLAHLPARDRRTVAGPLLANARQRLQTDDAAQAPNAADDGIEDAVNEATIPARHDRGEEATVEANDHRRTRPAEQGGSGNGGGNGGSAAGGHPDGGSGQHGGSGGSTPTVPRPGVPDHGASSDHAAHDGIPTANVPQSSGRD